VSAARLANRGSIPSMHLCACHVPLVNIPRRPTAAANAIIAPQASTRSSQHRVPALHAQLALTRNATTTKPFAFSAMLVQLGDIHRRM
jgi:hypothetical protein